MLQFWIPLSPPPRQWWIAGYPLQWTSAQGAKSVRVLVDDVRSAECPKSILLLDAEAATLADVLTEAEGTRALGPVHSWPGFLYDAARVVKRERERDEAAQHQALQRT